MKKIGKHGLYKFIHSLKLNNNKTDIDNVSRTIISNLKSIHNHIKHNEKQSKLVDFFIKKDKAYATYIIISLLLIIITKLNGYTLFWYNYLLTIMFGYIVVEKINVQCLKKQQEYDNTENDQIREYNAVVNKTNTLTTQNYSYDELKKISECLFSNEFNSLFSYFKLNPHKDNSTSKEALNKANETIRSANKRIAELKAELSSKTTNRTHYNSSSESLAKANETIREANLRINNLKKELEEAKEDSSATRWMELYNKKVAELIEKEDENENLKNTIKDLELSNLDKNEPIDFELGYYDIFGLKPDTTNSSVKNRYKQLSHIYHPDKCGSNIMMQRINVAYKKLSKWHK
ncbi:DnaJ domain-containing protein [Photobacterium kagoshimensis]|uniref:J domain-containing protein n=1 Tax=Photobacterium kagoshimensis TaxID=2910242 RepID=UPI003D0E2923